MTHQKASTEPHRVIGEFSGDPSCAVCYRSWPCPTVKQAGASDTQTVTQPKADGS